MRRRQLHGAHRREIARVSTRAALFPPITAMPSGHVRIGQCLKPQRQLRAPSNRAILRACLHCTSWSTTTSAAAPVMWSTTPAVSTPLLPFRFHDASVSGTAGRYNAPCGDPAASPASTPGRHVEGEAYDPTVDPDD